MRYALLMIAFGVALPLAGACTSSTPAADSNVGDGGTADGATAVAPPRDGGPSAPVDGGGPVATIASYCAARCSYLTRCPDADVDGEGPSCATTCETQYGTIFQNWRPGYRDHVTTCVSDLACGDSNDRCFSEFVAGDPRYPNIPEVQSCLERRTDCMDDGFSDDACAAIAAVNDTTRSKAEACLDEPCGSIQACILSVLGY